MSIINRITCLLTPIILINAIFAQADEQKGEIALFRLKSQKNAIPASSLESLEKSIRGVFSELSAFIIVDMPYKISTAAASELIQKIIELNQEGAEISEKVIINGENISEEDFQKLMQSSIIVLLEIADYSNESVTLSGIDKKYKAEIEISITFINTKEGKIIASRAIRTIGYDEEYDLALEDAINDVPINIANLVNSFVDFTIHSKIVDVRGDEVIIERGKGIDIVIGDQYIIIDPETLNGEKGLFIIFEIKERLALGKLFYTDGEILVGDEVKVNPRLGIDLIPYMHSNIPLTDVALISNVDEWRVYSGLRLVLSKYFFSFGPLIGVEAQIYPFELLETILPLRIYGGFEANIFWGRLQLSSTAAVGLQAYLATAENSPVNSLEFSHLGLMALISVAVLITKNLKLLIEGGWQAWFGVNEKYLMYYQSLWGGGVCIQF